MDEAKVKSSPWDIFINLLGVIALYASMWSALFVTFGLIDLGLPDPADGPFYIQCDSIRWSVAVLIVFLPACLWAWRAIEIDLATNPAKRTRWLRTGPIYLTLFVTGLLALGDLSSVIYYFLTGDLVLRVALKMAAIGVISGAVFYFYLKLLRHDPAEPSSGPPLFVYGSAVAALTLIVTGIAVAGSPAHAHLERLDATRVDNLVQIEQRVLAYRITEKKLPDSLDDLQRERFGLPIPTDPGSHQAYGYARLDDSSFQLCADFGLRDHDANGSIQRFSLQARDEVWNHDAGHFCFKRSAEHRGSEAD